jgi:YHS domain-containing protein
MTTRTLMLTGISFVLLTAGVGGSAVGAAAAEKTAIRGYDTVAYFTAGRAVKGSPSFAFSWHGMTWHFSSREHRDLFAAAPEKYAPQYDGWCAWAMTEMRLAETDPEVWKIVGGKLYLNCSPAAYEKWARDIPGNIEKADENWPKMKP